MAGKPKYNPQIHHRRSIRLKGYDYSKAGLYFITICCQNMQCRFGEIVLKSNIAVMEMNEFGQIAYDEWLKLADRFTNFELDVFQIMPNHMHGIIGLNDVTATLALATVDVGAGFTPAQNFAIEKNTEIEKWAGVNPAPTTTTTRNSSNSKTPTISDIIGAYKSLVSNSCLEIFKLRNETMGKLWQRDYYEHIIRNEQSYQRISDYIINNPDKWAEDKFYKAT